MTVATTAVKQRQPQQQASPHLYITIPPIASTDNTLAAEAFLLPIIRVVLVILSWPATINPTLVVSALFLLILR